MKNLVVYFSASGNTEVLAKKIANVVEGDLHQIIPEALYTKADLNWRDKNSRSSLEMADKTSRPAIANKVDNMDQYDTIYLGFPIWWYVAPTIINTFLEFYDLSGKTIVVYATSGSSGMGNTVAELKPSAPDATFIEGKVFMKSISEKALKEWVESL